MARVHCKIDGDCNGQKDCECLCKSCGVAARLQVIDYVENGWKERDAKLTPPDDKKVGQSVAPPSPAHPRER
jgi:hypothetical protein